MAAGGGAAGAAAAAAAAIAEAIKASGAVIKMKPGEFQKLLDRMEEPLVVVSEGGFFSTRYQYLTSYKGLHFYAKASEPLRLPSSAEVMPSEKIWMPG
ncbi:MAG TPA: hypothetical protein VLV83_14435 [Acidobacteriota bacterium]|nr:hypothetical protein [Acidobacteriota bacterium]